MMTRFQTMLVWSAALLIFASLAGRCADDQLARVPTTSPVAVVVVDPTPPAAASKLRAVWAKVIASIALARPLSKWPDVVPESAVAEAAEAAGGDPDAYFTYRYLFYMYRDIDRCTGGRVRTGHVNYYVTWRYDADHVAYADDLRMRDDIPPRISHEELALFMGCLSDYVSQHPVAGLEHLSSWGMQTDFPLEDEFIVRLARGEEPLEQD